MSRFDQISPKSGSFRAHLASAIPPNLVERLWGVGLDANGRIVKGVGQSGIVGVTVQTKAYPAGKRIDVMTHGQVVEFQPTDVEPGVGNTALAGRVYYSDAAGNITRLTDEVQTVTITNPANPITLTYSGQTTANIGPAATPAQVQAALEALSNLAPGDVLVEDDPGSPDYRVTFGGTLRDTDVAAMTASNATIATATAGGATTGLVRVGHTVEGQRLVVRVEP